MGPGWAIGIGWAISFFLLGWCVSGIKVLRSLSSSSALGILQKYVAAKILTCGSVPILREIQYQNGEQQRCGGKIVFPHRVCICLGEMRRVSLSSIFGKVICRFVLLKFTSKGLFVPSNHWQDSDIWNDSYAFLDPWGNKEG